MHTRRTCCAPPSAGAANAPGNLGAHLLRRGNGDRAAFAVLTFRESLHAIRAFAGEGLERATLGPEEARFPDRAQPTAMHYQVIERK